MLDSRKESCRVCEQQVLASNSLEKRGQVKKKGQEDSEENWCNYLVLKRGLHASKIRYLA